MYTNTKPYDPTRSFSCIHTSKQLEMLLFTKLFLFGYFKKYTRVALSSAIFEDSLETLSCQQPSSSAI